VVVVGGVDAAAAQEVADEVKALGGEALMVMTDVSQRVEIDALVDATLKRFGKIDILVNNAGIINPVPLLEMPEDQWDRTIAVHLKGTFNGTQAVAKHMKDQGGGKIINVSAPAAIRASSSGVSDYASAKGGIVAFTKNAARELAPYRINVNCISPAVYTRMTAALMEADHTTLEQRHSRVPLGWFGQPEDCAGAFVFFASKDADYVTGQVLAVDGGTTV
jgi:NAD(P)-dependent dehydrogenase (short-subunit alcohol dehydrogenase family)